MRDKAYVKRANKLYHIRHPEKMGQQVIKNRETYRIRREFINRTKSRPCMDCKVQYNPWVMDFDHRVREDKLFDIARWVQHASIAVLETEIAKCDIVCSNCHRERTHQYNETHKKVKKGDSNG